VFLASGLFDDAKILLAKGFAGAGDSHVADTLDLMPLALTKPLSGGASRGVLVELFDSHGPDSRVGNTASLMMGSTETTFYVLAVYFGSVRVRATRYTVAACLAADATGVVAAFLFCRLFF